MEMKLAQDETCNQLTWQQMKLISSTAVVMEKKTTECGTSVLRMVALVIS